MIPAEGPATCAAKHKRTPEGRELQNRRARERRQERACAAERKAAGRPPEAPPFRGDVGLARWHEIDGSGLLMPEDRRATEGLARLKSWTDNATRGQREWATQSRKKAPRPPVPV